MRPINRLLGLAQRAGLSHPIARALIAACDDATQTLRKDGRILPAIYFLTNDGTSKLRRFQFATACGVEAVRARVASDMRAGETLIAVLLAHSEGGKANDLAIHVESVNLAPVVFVAPVRNGELEMFARVVNAPNLIETKARLD